MVKNVYALGQLESVRNNITENISKHIEFIRESSKYGAQIIIFPEMSLTGYESYFEKHQLFTINDKRLDLLQCAADEYNVIVIVGAPLLIDKKAYISSLLILPNSKHEIYIKKHLHTGEDTFFHSIKDCDPVVKLNDDQLSFAICYDIEIDEHIRSAKSRDSSTYVASIFYSLKGIDSGIQRLEKLSIEYHMDILMANYVGSCWNTDAGGKSSVLTRRGEKIIEGDSFTECLLVAEKNSDGWIGKKVIF